MPASDRRAFWRERLIGLGCGLARSALALLAFEPFGLWGLAFLAPLPLCWFANRAQRPVRSGFWFAVGTSVFWGITHRWVAGVSQLGYPVMIAHLAALDWLALVLIARIHRRWPRLPLSLAIPTGWLFVEVLRGEILWSGYPWFLAGHPLVASWFLAAPAAWLGAYFASCLALVPSGAFLDLRAGRARPAIIGVGTAAGTCLAAAFLASPAPSPAALRIALVQTNVPQDNKIAWTMEERLVDWLRFESLTLQAMTDRPDVVVWPETMFPGVFLDPVRRHDEQGQEFLDHASFFVQDLFELQARIGVPMVVGAIGTEGLRTRETLEEGRIVERFEWDREHNSAYLVIDRSAPLRYDKVHLTPFGEVMPLISRWTWLERKLLALGATGMQFGLSPGPGAARAVLLPLREGISAAAPICFEVGDSSLCRSLVFGPGGRRAAVILNLTNDGWFGPVDGMRGHALSVARWRCIELGTPMARAANTGISCLIDARGRVIGRGVDAGECRTDGLLVGELPLPGGATPYSRIGNAFAWAVFLVGFAGILGRSPASRRAARADDSPNPPAGAA